MTITITDPELLARLRAVTGRVELRDPEGNLLIEADATNFCPVPPGVKSPFTGVELADLRKQRTGRPLAEILRDIQARG